MSDPELITFTFDGVYDVTVDPALGHLWVEHDGAITWDELQQIKNIAWGPEARAVEVYPAEGAKIDAIECRHLWRLGPTDFAPDLLGAQSDSLEQRYARAWAEATNG